GRQRGSPGWSRWGRLTRSPGSLRHFTANAGRRETIAKVLLVHELKPDDDPVGHRLDTRHAGSRGQTPALAVVLEGDIDQFSGPDRRAHDHPDPGRADVATAHRPAVDTDGFPMNETLLAAAIGAFPQDEFRQ